MKAAGLVAALALTAPAAAQAAPATEVGIRSQAFAPDHLDVLVGETVTWRNVSQLRHTVTADDGSFSSDDLFGQATFAHRFDTISAVTYHCTVHPGMVGEVDVRRVTLAPLPALPVPSGDRVTFAGRTADPDLPVRVERTDATTQAPVATAVPDADGTWTASAVVTSTSDYRAVSDAGSSGARRLLVADRRIRIRATRHGVAVRVTPPLPYGRILLEEDLRERFGWWPVRRARLDYVSAATFAVRRPARVRVALLDRDGRTALVTSEVLRLPARRSG